MSAECLDFSSRELNEVISYQDVMQSRCRSFNQFFIKCCNRRLPCPSAFEAGFMSLAHSEQDIARTLAAADIAFATLK